MELLQALNHYLNGTMSYAELDGNKISIPKQIFVENTGEINFAGQKMQLIRDQWGFPAFTEIGYKCPSYVWNGLRHIRGMPIITGKTFAGKECWLAPYRRMGATFTVVISSNTGYEGKTVKKLVRSLHNDGVDDIIVAVSGCNKGLSDIETDNGVYARVGVPAGWRGLSGLLPFYRGNIDINKEYILLLHDTCEVVSGFFNTMINVDISYPVDFIGFVDSKNSLGEMGFYSTYLLDSIEQSDLLGIKSYMKMSYYLTDKATALNSRDVYQTGNKRSVADLGSLKKFSSVGDKP